VHRAQSTGVYETLPNKKVRMPIPMRISSVPPTTWQRGSEGMRPTARWPPEQDFYYARLLLAGAGRVAILAEALCERGYPELARPRDERGVIGHFAVGVLAGTGWWL
jgi:hypothetical protein